MNRATEERVTALGPPRLDVLEISGSAWASVGFHSYRNVAFPDFDICRQRLSLDFDLIIAEQVFEHVPDPVAAAHNVLRMLRPGGTFLITTPFLIKIHPAPLDLWRWSAEGLKAFLGRVGFVRIEAHSWGNRACVVGNFEGWPLYDPTRHSLDNEPDFPLVVWAFAMRAQNP